MTPPITSPAPRFLRVRPVTACLIVIAGALLTVGWTTVHHERVGSYDCGSPIDPVEHVFSPVAVGDLGYGPVPSEECGPLLDRARSTRTIALLWLSAALGALCLMLWIDRERPSARSQPSG